MVFGTWFIPSCLQLGHRWSSSSVTSFRQHSGPSVLKENTHPLPSLPNPNPRISETVWMAPFKLTQHTWPTHISQYLRFWLLIDIQIPSKIPPVLPCLEWTWVSQTWINSTNFLCFHKTLSYLAATRRHNEGRETKADSVSRHGICH